MPEPPAPGPRRPRALALLVLLAVLPGCIDGLGVAADCSAEMAAVRLQEGSGPDRSSGPQELNGNFTEHWTYTRARRTYTFRWGASFSGCEVDPGSFVRLPETPIHF